jgi:hypothetical protein
MHVAQMPATFNRQIRFRLTTASPRRKCPFIIQGKAGLPQPPEFEQARK